MYYLRVDDLESNHKTGNIQLPSHLDYQLQCPIKVALALNHIRYFTSPIVSDRY